MVKQYDYIVNHEEEGIRIDRFIAGKSDEFSRSFVQKLILDGHITVDDQKIKPSYNIRAGNIVRISIPDLQLHEAPQAEDIPLDIIFEDDELLVVNKPAGMVVHPAAGVNSGTLVNAFLAHISDEKEEISGEEMVDLSYITPGRPGIVHRLDKGTSGIIVLAKTVKAYYHLADQFKEHTIHRKYIALVCGNLKPDSGIIVAPIGRSHRDRKKMAVTPVNSREAITQFSVTERYGGYSLLDIFPKTGRTHQIRVHLAHIGHPVVGDTAYSSRKKDLEAAKQQAVRIAIQGLSRQALHAQILGFIHPDSGKYMEFSTPIPKDMQEVIDALRAVLDVEQI
jgi:23S rRNA pseudouridine1911/1915/1917 synthase